MLLSFKWLSEFVEMPSGISAKDVADQLTMAGLEVESCVEDLEQNDTILEIKITPNRPDALSHIGIARELAALLQTRFYVPNSTVKELGAPIHDVAQVHVLAKQACLRYACRIIDGVSIKESPVEIRTRLQALGIRPINNVVDITNLVLLERGQPLHAFDLLTLQKNRHRAMLQVRQAEAGEKLTTLDGKERNLTPEDVVITDGDLPVSLAGVMGGKDSEVTMETTSVLLEAAYFEPSVVRQMARRHGLSTEASYRFERGTDPNMVISALDRAADLIAQHASGRVRREVIDVYPKSIGPLEIHVRKHKIADISGLSETDLDEGKIRSRFLSLGIETVGRRGDALIFRVPTFRPDLTREIDLIEEAMRLIGFDKVPSRLLFSKRVSAKDYAEADKYIDRTRQSLIASGFFEAINFSFGSPHDFNLFKLQDAPELIRVANPLGEELSVMRQSLLPALLKNVALNVRKGAKSVRLFEIGNVFLGRNPLGKVPNIELLQGKANQDAWAIEKLRVAGVGFGSFGIDSFDTKPREIDFYDLKGVLESLFLALKVASDCVFSILKLVALKQPIAFLHPGISAEIWVHDKKEKNEIFLGIIGKIHPDICGKFGLEQDVYGFELDMEALALLSKEDEQVKAMPKFPEITRDLAFLLDENITAEQLQSEILKSKELKPFISDVRIFDVYKGPKIEKGKKSIAVSLTLRALDRTLTDSEVASWMQSLIENLQHSLSLVIR